MTKDQARAAAQVLLAYAEGQEIQCQWRGDGHALWRNVPEPSFNFQEQEYRIKPKPREWWVAVNEHGVIVTTAFTKEIAIQGLCGYTAIKVREVIE